MLAALLLSILLQADELLSATRDGDLSRVAALLDAGTAVDIEANNGMTALHVAAVAGHHDLAELLLTRGARVDDRAANGMTPLMRASLNGRNEVVRLLLAAGADVDIQAKFGATALMSAVEKGRIQTVRLLLAAGATVDARADNGETALSLAARRGRADILALLSGRGEQGAHLDAIEAELEIERARLHYRRAVDFEQHDQPERAIESLRLALERRPDYPEALYRLARILERVGEWQDGILHYQKSLDAYRGLVDAGEAFDETFASLALEDMCDVFERFELSDRKEACDTLRKRLLEGKGIGG